MSNRKCVNCEHNIRTGTGGDIKCHCDIDGRGIGYIKCFTHWCRRWKRDKTWATQAGEGKQDER